MKNYKRLIISDVQNKALKESKVADVSALPVFIVYAVYEGVKEYCLSPIFHAEKHAQNLIDTLPNTTKFIIERIKN